MEDSLGHKMNIAAVERNQMVLILVVMEDSLGLPKRIRKTMKS